MSVKRHGPKDISRKLERADARLAEGATVAEVCKELAISEQTYYRWRGQHGRRQVPPAETAVVRLQEIEAQNDELKRLVAELVLKIRSLKGAQGEPFDP